MPTVLSRLVLPALLLGSLCSAVQSVAGPVPGAAAAPSTGPARLYVANSPLGEVVGYADSGAEVSRRPTQFGPDDAFAVGDVDGDGVDDPLVADVQGGGVLAYLRTGLVAAVGDLGYDVDPGAEDALRAGDVNGDGVDELVVANAPEGTVVAYDVGGTVVAEVTGTGFDSDGGNGPDGFAVGDVDGDGADELVVAHAPEGNVVAWTAGNLELTEATGTGFDADPGTGRDGFAVGDVDGEGIAELLVANAPGGEVVALPATGGSPVKTVQAGFDADPGAEDRIAAGDVNADGIGDVAIAQAPGEQLDIHFGGGGFGTVFDSGFDSQAGSLDGFAVGTDTGRDLDGDAIPDRVERHGVRAADGMLLLTPSNPCRETINIEVDYEDRGGSFAPDPVGIADVTAAFDRAPRSAVPTCPYPDVQRRPGIELRVKVDEPLTATGPVGSFESFDAIKAAHFQSELDPYVHYNPWAEVVVNRDTGDQVAGYCCYGRFDKDFIGESGGDALDQGLTIMHELGHALGLGHGGSDDIDDKPHHFSVMNSAYDWGTLRDDRRGSDGKMLPQYEFSDDALPGLDETALSEPAGLGTTEPYEALYVDADGTARTVPANGPVDWDGDDPTGVPDDVGVQLNVNGDAENGFCVGPGADGDLDTDRVGDDVRTGQLIRAGANLVCDSAKGGDDVQLGAVGTAPPLTAHDDWAAIRLGGSRAGGGSRNFPEPTKAEVEQHAAVWDQAQSPDTSVALAPARPGFDGQVLGLAVDGNRIFATHHYVTTAQPPTSDRPGTLAVLDRATLAVRARVPVGYRPQAVAVNPVTKRVYVLSGTGDPDDPTKSWLTVLDRTTLAVVARVEFATAQAARDVAVNPRTNRVYVSNTSQDRLHVFDGATNQELAPIHIGPAPTGLAVDPTTNTVYAAQSRHAAGVAALGSVVDDGVTRTVNPPVSLGPPLTQPVDVAVDPGRDRVYVGNLGGGGVQPSLSVLDGATRAVRHRVPLPGPTRAVAVNPYGHRVFLASEGPAATVDTDAVEVARTADPDLAFSVAVEPGPSREVYYGDVRSGQLTRLSYSSGEPA